MCTTEPCNASSTCHGCGLCRKGGARDAAHPPPPRRQARAGAASPAPSAPPRVPRPPRRRTARPRRGVAAAGPAPTLAPRGCSCPGEQPRAQTAFDVTSCYRRNDGVLHGSACDAASPDMH